MSKLVSRRNIDFLLFDWLRLDDLLARPLYEDHDRDTVTSVIDLGAQIAQEQFAPINQLLDAQEPTMADDGTVLHPDGLKQALAAYTDSGLPSAAFPPELGGMLLPFSVVHAVFVHLHAASMGAGAFAAQWAMKSSGEKLHSAVSSVRSVSGGATTSTGPPAAYALRSSRQA